MKRDAIDQSFERLPPHSMEAEMCCLASMMLDPIMLDELLAVVDRDWFYATDNRILFEAIAGLRRADRPVDAIILRDELKRLDKLDAVGGTGYLGEILGKVPSAAHGKEYAATLVRLWRLRTAISIGTRLIQAGYDATADGEQVLGSAAADIAAAVSGSSTSNVVKFDAVLDQVQAELHRPRDEIARDFTRTGFASIDERITGLRDGEILHLGARPSMGKSTLLRQIAINAAAEGEPVLLVSLEETPPKIGRNVLSWKAQVENRRIRSGEVKRSELDRIDRVAERLRDYPVYIVRGVSEASKIRAIVASHKARFGIRLVVLDYLQRVNAGGRTDYERATFSSNFVTGMTRELDLRMVAAVQLSREVTHREDKRPTMTDVRSSGQIEQDSDVLLLLHREDYYHLTDASYTPTGVAEVIIEKARDGERGDVVELRSHMDTQCFVDPLSGTQHEVFADDPEPESMRSAFRH